MLWGKVSLELDGVLAEGLYLLKQIVVLSDVDFCEPDPHLNTEMVSECHYFAGRSECIHLCVHRHVIIAVEI